MKHRHDESGHDILSCITLAFRMPQTSDARETGVIKSVTIHGYGFIRRALDPKGNKRTDIFVHAAECNNQFDEFKPGTRVVFTLGEDSRGRTEAKNVQAAI